MENNFRSFVDSPLEHHWTIWTLNDDIIDIKAKQATFKDGILILLSENHTAMFKDFRAAIQCAHGNFGQSNYWISDGKQSHIVEANFHSWDNGCNVFIQTNHDPKIEQLVAVIPNAAWWSDRDMRIYPDNKKCFKGLL